MAIKDFTFTVGKNEIAETVTYNGDILEVTGVDSSVIAALLSPSEIAEEVNLIKLLQALVKTHGLGEVIFELVENNTTEDILNHVYEADDDAVRSWVSDTFSDNE